MRFFSDSPAEKILAISFKENDSYRSIFNINDAPVSGCEIEATYMVDNNSKTRGVLELVGLIIKKSNRNFEPTKEINTDPLCEIKISESDLTFLSKSFQ